MYIQVVSMKWKYHNHTLQINPWHDEEEPQNIRKTSEMKLKQSSQLSLPHQGAKLERTPS